MLERQIIIGLITSTDFIKKIRTKWDSLLMDSSTARMLANWCIEFYDKYGEAPNKEIEKIFIKKSQEGLDDEIAEEIEEDLLPDLSDEYANSEFNLDHLFEQTVQYLNIRKLEQVKNQLDNLVDNDTTTIEDRIRQGQQIIEDFKKLSDVQDESIDLSTQEAIPHIEKAFEAAAEPLYKFPKQLGQFWNHQLVPGGFISFLAPEKRGKTFWLLEHGMRALRNHKNVAFFQAGDMNEAEQLKRIAVYLTKNPVLEKYCTSHLEPVRDCMLNQLGECNRPQRECDFGVFEDMTEQQVMEMSAEDLHEAFEDNQDYIPCHNCRAYNTNKYGAPWFKRIPECQPTEAKDAVDAITKFFKKYKGSFRLSTHANGTLSVDDMLGILDNWELDTGFVPDLIIIDYADLLVPGRQTEFRHQQNQIWKDLRRLSQTKRKDILPLVIAPTQADAKAYKSFRLELDNFSEDKRKYAHVTAMYGLNQDPKGREKELGIMRINEIIIREGEYSNNNEVTVLQNLRRGRPFISSYFSNKNK